MADAAKTFVLHNRRGLRRTHSYPPGQAFDPNLWLACKVLKAVRQRPASLEQKEWQEMKPQLILSNAAPAHVNESGVAVKWLIRALDQWFAKTDVQSLEKEILDMETQLTVNACEPWF